MHLGGPFHQQLHPQFLHTKSAAFIHSTNEIIVIDKVGAEARDGGDEMITKLQLK